MPDRQTRVIEYEIRGNTVNLEREVAAALKIVTDLETKLTGLATGGRRGAGLPQATLISRSMSRLESIKKTFLGMPQAVSPDQLNTVNAAINSMARTTITLGKAAQVSSESLKKVDKSLKNVEKGFKAADLAGKKFSLILRTLKFALVSKAIHVLTSNIMQGLQSAIDYVETVNLFNVAAGKSAETLGNFANQFNRIFGTDPNEVLKYVGTFNILATSVGASAQQAELLSTNLTKLTYDLSSLFNTDVEDMAVAVRSGMTGISKPLKQYGIVLNEAMIQQEAALLGITTSWRDLGEVDKIGLRYIALLRQSSKAQGDFAKTLESPQNQMKVLKAQLALFFRNIGTIILIAGKIILPTVNGIMIGINRLLAVFAKAAGYDIPNFANNLNAASTSAEDAEDDVNSLGKAVGKALMPFDEFNQLTEPADNGSLFEMDPRISAALEEYDNLMDRVQTKAGQIGDAMERAFSPSLMEGFGRIVGTVFTVIGVGFNAFANILKMLAPVIGAVGNALAPIFKGLGWLIEKLMTPITLWIEGVTSNIWVLVGAFAALNLAIWAITGSASKMIAVKMAVALYEWGKTAALAIVNYIKLNAAILANTLATIKNTIVQWWQNASLIAKIGLLTMGAGLILVPIILAATGAFKKEANNVPKMATGGVATAPTVAMIGEGRYNEAVVPLGNSPQFATMKEDIATAVAGRVGAGGGSEVLVKVYIGDREFKSFTYKTVDEENRRVTGMSLERLSKLAVR